MGAELQDNVSVTVVVLLCREGGGGKIVWFGRQASGTQRVDSYWHMCVP